MVLERARRAINWDYGFPLIAEDYNIAAGRRYLGPRGAADHRGEMSGMTTKRPSRRLAETSIEVAFGEQGRA
jgi:hypothetical protein